jgi:glycosyltransferase involved in cell wall biosynthesis
VPPAGYGGTERVISVLTEELVRRGHQVTLFAAGDSVTSARLVPLVPRALWHLDPPSNDFGAWQPVISNALREYLHAFDVFHSHLDYLGLGLAANAPRPVVSTIHGRLDVPRLVHVYRAFASVPLVSISHAQRRPLPNANWIATIYHGIDVQAFTFNPRPGGYLAFLGRISPEKGLDTAIRVARRAGMPIRIAARPPLPFAEDPESQRDRDYFEVHIQPLLREPGVELIGEVSGSDKNALLSGAAALLFPIRWPEPFGLVMPEAMVRSVEHMSDLDRHACRVAVETRFSPAAMADAYEQVYARLLEGAPLDSSRLPGQPAYV